MSEIEIDCDRISFDGYTAILKGVDIDSLVNIVLNEKSNLYSLLEAVDDDADVCDHILDFLVDTCDMQLIINYLCDRCEEDEIKKYIENSRKEKPEEVEVEIPPF